MTRIAVLGAGLMGSATAVRLARDGHQVVLYDRAPRPMEGASRWNEGKIHLGFLYAGDPTFRSAERLLPGGLAFRPLVERLIGTRLRQVTEEDDLFLVHRDSVVDAEATRAYFDSLVERVRAHPASGDYLVDVSRARVRPLDHRELAQLADTDTVIAGFRVPERSIATAWLADRVTGTVLAEPGITLRLATEVRGVRVDHRRHRSSYSIDTAEGLDDGFDVVVNALWEGRLSIDATMGLAAQPPWSHRYRVSLFLETRVPVAVPSFVLCTGPFGDVKRYSPCSFYLSWYPAGLMATGEGLQPPLVPSLDPTEAAERQAAVVDALARVVPAVGEVAKAARWTRLAGGWVFASGTGLLSDPRSTLHRRDRVGITRLDRYFSVDTGKYSIAPWLAEQLARDIREHTA